MTEEGVEYKPKGKHGGPGRGQGRKPGVGNKNPPPPREIVTFRLPEEITRLLKQEENQTALILKLLKEYYGV